jgi:hypothetical protein
VGRPAAAELVTAGGSTVTPMSKPVILVVAAGPGVSGSLARRAAR